MAHLNVIEAETKDKVKALVSALEEGGDTLRVIAALEEYGRDAAPAIPLLKKLKSSPVDAIRKAAAKAIEKIE